MFQILRISDAEAIFHLGHFFIHPVLLLLYYIWLVILLLLTLN